MSQGQSILDLRKVGGASVALGQAAMAASFPVVLASDQSAIPVTVSGVATAANQTTIIGHLDGVEGLLTTIDADTGGILTAVQLIDNAISGTEMQVDIVAALPTGTNVIGSVKFLDESNTPTTVITSGSDATSNTNNQLIVAGMNYVYNGTSWDMVRGSVTDGMLVNLGSNNDVVATNAGTFAVQESGAALTALQLLDNIVATTDAVAGASPVGVPPLAVRDDVLTTLTPVDGDFVPFRTDQYGALWVSLATKLNSTDDSVTAVINGLTPGTTATDLGKAEDAAHASGDTGVMMLAVRRDSRTASSGTNGDYEPLSTNNAGELRIVGNQDEDSAHTSGHTGLFVLGRRIDTKAASSGTSGDYEAFNMDALGALWTADNQTEDVAHSSGDRGSFCLAIRSDTLAASSGTTGDYEGLHTDSVGALWCRSSAEIADDAAFTVATSRVMPVGLLADETSTDSVDEGDIGVPRMTLNRMQITANYAHTAGGWTPHKAISAASTNATSLKGSAGQVGGFQCFNLNAAPAYLKFYNKATSPTVGTDTPVKVIMIPGNTAGAGVVMGSLSGVYFSTGIAYAITTGIADSNTGAVAANEVIVNIDWL